MRGNRREDQYKTASKMIIMFAGCPRDQKDTNIENDENHVDDGKSDACNVIDFVAVQRVFVEVDMSVDCEERAFDPVREASRVAGVGNGILGRMSLMLIHDVAVDDGEGVLDQGHEDEEDGEDDPPVDGDDIGDIDLRADLSLLHDEGEEGGDDEGYSCGVATGWDPESDERRDHQ